MTHILIVNDRTFKYHLEYLFIGTGAANKNPLFLLDSQVVFPYATERNLVGMIADISRIRKGDTIVFYLTGSAKFYGFFKASEDAFYCDDDYLYDKLDKHLSFRLCIEPQDVYADGVSECEFLDSLNDIDKPYQMCWSLIYRKLKGNRGCTMIFDYEEERLRKMISDKNRGTALISTVYTLDISDWYNPKIIAGVPQKYVGKKKHIDISNRLLYKYSHNNAFEVHLQAYLMQKYDTAGVKKFLFPLDYDNHWIGNEISCGVGMQRIDIMSIEENDKNVYIRVVELKDEKPDKYNIMRQLCRYVEWTLDYVVPNFSDKAVTITPVILAAKSDDTELIEKCALFNTSFSGLTAKINNVDYYCFNVSDESISFEKVNE